MTREITENSEQDIDQKVAWTAANEQDGCGWKQDSNLGYLNETEFYSGIVCWDADENETNITAADSHFLLLLIEQDRYR